MTNVVLKVAGQDVTFILLTAEEFDYWKRGRKVIGRREVAKRWGMSVNRLSECPYLLPDGDAQRGKRNAQWFESDVDAMVKLGRDRCREIYDAGSRYCDYESVC